MNVEGFYWLQTFVPLAVFVVGGLAYWVATRQGDL